MPLVRLLLHNYVEKASAYVPRMTVNYLYEQAVPKPLVAPLRAGKPGGGPWGKRGKKLPLPLRKQRAARKIPLPYE